ncbi:hypothetical protein [Halosimplex amylolyticum]|uniref:hypothetical protein n=1 Tax=Halosimplex amylolyticum TaxID=3396616 RepID=UPI003F56BF85
MSDDRAVETYDAASKTTSLLSRTLLTWLELTVVGITGGAVGAAVGGPPAFIAYLLTTLVSVGILFHNVAALVDARIAAAHAPDASASGAD